MLERFCHCLEHILQRADSGENHGNVKNNGKKLSQRDILQNGGQRDKKQPGSRSDIKAVGKAGGNNDERCHHRRDGIKQRRVLCNADNVLLWGKIGPIDNHAAAGDRKREKCLTHCPDPDHRVGKRLPAGGEHKAIALRRTGEEKYPHRQYQKDEEEKRHHDLIGFFDAVRPQKQSKQRTCHYNDVIGND